jgi:DNA-binding NtrC family response regulator
MESIPEGSTPILTVDDDVGLLTSIKATLVSSGLPEPALVSDSRKVIALVRKHQFNLVLLDLIMPHVGGMDLLKQIKHEFPAIECMIVSALDEVPLAVSAIQYGAYDYLVKPFENEKLVITVKRALEKYNLRHNLTLFESPQSFCDLKNPSAFEAMIAKDSAMALVFHQAEAAAPTDYNVVITGESGTGKEMLAKAIHALSQRSRGAIVSVNMAASNTNLFEDDLFGHVRGAFTGAVSEKKGFFETARGGTLFLDEIADLALPLQSRLLRVIEEREFYRLGSTEARSADVRILSATNRDIKSDIKDGRFREDLFFRLNTCNIHIPPLRERKEDILPLAHYFLQRHAGKNKKRIDSLAPGLVDRLFHYPFPGNVRELENIIAEAVLLEKGKILTLASAPALATAADDTVSPETDFLTLAEIERRHIERVLTSAGENRTKAAKILGIGLRTLQRKLKEFSAP